MPDEYWDESSADLGDHEYPDADPRDDEDTDTVTCPECDADVYEDADQCPVCGEYLIPDTRVWSGKPNWWIALGILGIAALTVALILGFGF